MLQYFHFKKELYELSFFHDITFFRVRIQMLNCPTLPVVSRNQGYLVVVLQNPNLSGIWAALQMCQIGALGVPQKEAIFSCSLPLTKHHSLALEQTVTHKKTISWLTATSHSRNQVNEINGL